MAGKQGWRDADLAFVNGRVITVNGRDEIFEAVAVAGNRIARVGSNESIRELVGNSTRMVDLAGRALTPGFVENHMHIPNAAENRKWVDCSPEAVSSIAEIVAAVAKRVGESPPGNWVLGWGFDHHRLKERRYPTRHDLDPVSPNHPVALRQRESMSWTANTAALRRMGIQDDTPDPPGGPMRRDSIRCPARPNVGQLPGGLHPSRCTETDSRRVGARLQVGLPVPEQARHHQRGRGRHPWRAARSKPGNSSASATGSPLVFT